MFINLNVIVTYLRHASILGNNREFARLWQGAQGWAGLRRTAEDIWKISEQSVPRSPHGFPRVRFWARFNRMFNWRSTYHFFAHYTQSVNLSR
ncbi:hypothetical protein [Microcoleus sp. bin38.metabat.b11b12b14.051]|uniref:hypothetical protein n=1 Tax=Microcoleus sp. bin38.metabat.b11b12b14.051 TaxID=2742709 RepID=UPI0025D2F1B4|nr:hypothetical protein [Microcoleus sp. bin38.metabat.b11b12b14.051]